MAANKVKHLRAVLEPANNGLGWLVVRVPTGIETEWTTKVRQRVKICVAGQTFRTSFFPDAVHGGSFILFNKQMQKAAAARVGTMIDLSIEPDLDDREAVLTPQFEAVLKKEKKLAKWYAEQSQSMQREVGKWLGQPKSVEARQRRAEQMAERMLLAMEGERVLPPVIEVAFTKRPAARKGWELLTVTQRRNSLLAVFYYQSPEARQKRVQKLVEECLNAAGR